MQIDTAGELVETKMIRQETDRAKTAGKQSEVAMLGESSAVRLRSRGKAGEAGRRLKNPLASLEELGSFLHGDKSTEYAVSFGLDEEDSRGVVVEDATADPVETRPWAKEGKKEKKKNDKGFEVAKRWIDTLREGGCFTADSAAPISILKPWFPSCREEKKDDEKEEVVGRPDRQHAAKKTKEEYSTPLSLLAPPPPYIHPYTYVVYMTMYMRPRAVFSRPLHVMYTKVPKIRQV